MLTFFSSWQNETLFDRLTGSLNDYIGFENGSYFIEVPEGQIDEFFHWNSDYPDLVSAHRGGFTLGFPENAIATFENTLATVPALLWAEGQTILELDLKSDEYTSEVVEIINDLTSQQRESLFTSVYADGGDAIASDYYQQTGSIIGYPVEDELDILLVNDDGFDAEGINVLFDGLTEAGYNVTLVAPKEQQSGKGTLINVDKIFQPTEVVKFADNKWFVDGSPVVTTLAGLDFILNGTEPDLVIAGINEGANIGENIVISSGTVSAATTATRKGLPAIAVSAGGNTEAELDAAYEAGTEFVIDLIEELEAKQAEGEELLPDGVGLSVNIPGTFAEGVDGIQGVALTQLDAASNINLSFGELPEGFGEGVGLLVSFNENIAPDEINNPTSEGENFLAGKITVTPLDGSWVADSTVREAIESRATAEIAIPEVTPLDILLTNDDGFEAEGIEVIYSNPI